MGQINSTRGQQTTIVSFCLMAFDPLFHGYATKKLVGPDYLFYFFIDIFLQPVAADHDKFQTNTNVLKKSYVYYFFPFKSCDISHMHTKKHINEL